MRPIKTALFATAALAGLAAAPARADEGILEHLRRHSLVTSTVPENGDQNPYAIVVAPASVGKIAKDDVLISNFNDSKNLQGKGRTIVSWRPSTQTLSTFATLPEKTGCPGGVGLTTAMAVLKSGWVVVGSLPSTDGTTATKGQGCLLVLDSNGQLAETITGPEINGPWGNMAVVDRGDRATLFVSDTGFGVGAPGQGAVNKANVVRLDLAIPAGGKPTVTKRTVIADGLGEQADKDVFIIGPTGLALSEEGILYVSDAINNRVVAIDDAETRSGSAGTGREVTKDGFLKRPLAMAMAPNRHLIVTNGQNGKVVEIDPRAGRQIYAQWVDPNKAQTPPGSGDLFGIAFTSKGDGFYYVEDEMNGLALAH